MCLTPQHNYLSNFSFRHNYYYLIGDRCGLDRVVVGFTTTCVISAYHHYSDEFEPCL